MADQHTSNNMPHYAPNNYYPPQPAGTRSRGSSTASRYLPDGYPIPAPPSNTASNDYLAPAQPVSQPTPDANAFTPARPEQYRAPPNTQGIPPAQLRPYHPDAYVRSRSDGYEPRRSGEGHRRSSVDSRHSRYSDDPRRSGHSVRSHRSSHESHRDARRREYEREKDEDDYELEQEARHQEPHHHHHHHHHDDDLHLKRRDTPRGYGSSLFAIFGHIKNALNGG